MPQVSVENAMKLALQCQQNNLPVNAEALYREVLVWQPDNSEALRLLGVLARKSGKLESAVELIQKSIAIDPARAEAHRDLGDVLRAQGKFDQAAAAYSQAIKLLPDWAEAHGALGNTFKDQGKLDQAIEQFTKAIQLKPNLAMAHLRLADALHEQGKREAAMAAYAMAVRLNPDSAEVYNGMGNVLWDEGKLDQAIAAYSKAIRYNPAYLQANWSLGKILALQEKLPESAECFRRATELNPTNARARLNHARILKRIGQRDEAVAQYQSAIRFNPDSPNWAFELAAYVGDESVTTTPARYIKNLFDGYASTFDDHLIKSLAYRSPKDLLESIVAATPRRDMDILDLGCGTGLCGEQLRTYSRQLTGVDLSPAMIKAAEARGIYDRLVTGDLMSVLNEAPERYDLIVAGDVLIYVGDLAQLMPAAALALRGAGLIAFSIEHYDGPGFRLLPHERFGHSMTYIREMAASVGLKEISARKVILRKEGATETAGWIVVLAKPEGRKLD
jgi:predicted TPR repeat methyltransferase